MFTLIQNADVYAPEFLGKKDVLLTEERILAVGELEAPSGYETEVIDGSGKILLPGLIDSHVHIIGGGGEGGYHTRTPELKLSDAVSAGITTLVGVIGTDGTTRTTAELIAKARGLEEEGISCYVHVGNYHVPVRTVTGSIEDDLLLIDRIIGVGEIAVSDHRSSQPSTEELARLASKARIGGMLSGKAGIVNVHIGDGRAGLQPLLDVIDTTDLPLEVFCPTHVNRSEALFQQGLDFARRGGVIDFTTSTIPSFLEEGEVKAAKAVRFALEAGINPAQLTMTSDGQGSLPSFDKEGKFNGLQVASAGSLFEALRETVMEEKVVIEHAVRTVTGNPARILKLEQKGTVAKGKDADLLLVDQDWQITDVWAMGRKMMSGGELIVKGTFE